MVGFGILKNMNELAQKWYRQANEYRAKQDFILGNRWYSSLSEQEKKDYQVAQAWETALRSCANELTNAGRKPIMTEEEVREALTP